MKIAFTSCMSTQVFADQPVWDDIAKLSPDQLVLTGDSIYIDAIPHPTHPKAMDPDDFQRHVFGLWRALVDQPQFAALVRQVPTSAIWDDHDFLWNEAYDEKAITKRVYRDKLRWSRAVFNAFRRALAVQLAAGLPGSFPDVYNVQVLNDPNEPAPGYQFKDLGEGVALHLTDGRSWRLRNVLLGQAQRDQIATAMLALPPDTVHLLASGSVVEDHKGDRWGDFEDYAWLLGLARQHRIIVLSGDIHENRFDAIDLGAGKTLYDATASGAAIRRGVTAGAERRNFGLIEIGADEIVVSFSSLERPVDPAPRRISRATWALVA